MNPNCKTCKHKLTSTFKAPCNECVHSDPRYTDKYEAAIKPDCDSCKHQQAGIRGMCYSCTSDYSNFESRVDSVKSLPVACGTCFWGTFSGHDGDKCLTCDPTTFSNFKRAANFAPLKRGYGAAMPAAAPAEDYESTSDPLLDDLHERDEEDRIQRLSTPSPVAPPTLADFQAAVANRTTVLSPGHAAPYAPHPLQEAYDAAIAQATGGKGVRHGGATKPFFEQPWYSIAKHTGEGGLIFQGVKKAQEACGKGKDEDEAFERELLGSLVYLGMAYLYFKRHGRK